MLVCGTLHCSNNYGIVCAWHGQGTVLVLVVPDAFEQRSCIAAAIPSCTACKFSSSIERDARLPGTLQPLCDWVSILCLFLLHYYHNERFSSERFSSVQVITASHKSIKMLNEFGAAYAKQQLAASAARHWLCFKP
jgi:hypothetical protein